jgi:hypothetical protein
MVTCEVEADVAGLVVAAGLTVTVFVNVAVTCFVVVVGTQDVARLSTS